VGEGLDKESKIEQKKTVEVWFDDGEDENEEDNLNYSNNSYGEREREKEREREGGERKEGIMRIIVSSKMPA